MRTPRKRGTAQRVGAVLAAVATVAISACSIFTSYDGLSEGVAPALAGDAGQDGVGGSVPGSERDGASGALDAAVDVGRGSDCDPAGTPTEMPCRIREGAGIFVSRAGNDANPGTPSAPVATIQRGLELARVAKKPLLLCAHLYFEQVKLEAIDDGLQIFGGLSCPTRDAGTDGGFAGDGGAEAGASADGGAAGWAYTGQRAVIAPFLPGMALTLKGFAHPAVIEDVDFTARTPFGVDGTGAGRSSIAVFVSESPQGVTFRRSTITAGAGTRGSSGGNDSNFSSPQAAGGNSPSTAQAGAAVQTCTCRLAGSSIGGKGGDPAPPMAGDNGSATPAPATIVAPRDGKGGLPVPTGSKECEEGHYGAHGTPAPLPAAGGASYGVVSASGWAPQAGADGVFGTPGQGGGGGAGAQGSLGLLSPGGGGGCGGCGGSGGVGGRGGGGSIALVAFETPVRLEACALTTSNGGAGGAGVGGQDGQAGGDRGPARSGPATSLQCAGGGGGHGAGGGGGGGGAGGVSVGIAYSGSPPTIDGVVVPDAVSLPRVAGGGAGTGGAPGSGSSGGGTAQNGGPAGTAGRDGLVQAVKAFP